MPGKSGGAIPSAAGIIYINLIIFSFILKIFA